MKTSSTVLLSLEDVLEIHAKLVSHFSDTNDPIDPPGPKDLILLGSAVERPKTSLGHTEKYPAIEQKGAALFHSLAMNHGFHNGNKRTALLALLAFLDRNDMRLKNEVADDDVLKMVVDVASDRFPEPRASADQVVEALAQWLGSRISSKRARTSSMKTREFIESCTKAGLHIREDKIGWKVLGKNGLIKVPRAKREIGGNVLRIYMQNLGLSEVETGISVDEFQDGISGENVIIHRFNVVLKRLAHA